MTIAKTSFDLEVFLSRVAYQLFDAGSSVGANRSESKSAYSDKEFASKNAICLKEVREAKFWLRLAEAKSLGNRSRRAKLLREAQELTKIYAATVRTLKAQLQKSGGNANETGEAPPPRRARTAVRIFRYEVPGSDTGAKTDVRKPENEK